MPLVTATAWLPRGTAKRHPKKFQLTDETYDRLEQRLTVKRCGKDAENTEPQGNNSVTRISEQSNSSESGKSDQSKDGSGSESQCDDEGHDTSSSEDDDLKEYNLDLQDSDEENDRILSIFGDHKGLVYHTSDQEDEYMTGPCEEDEREEQEELEILPTDDILLSTRTEDDMAFLEVHVYERNADNLYVHHDVILPDIPLCVEWMNYSSGDAEASLNSIIAVGTMDRNIELWNLDVIDAVCPDAILGDDSCKTRPTEPTTLGTINDMPNDDYHVDAVLSLSANRLNRKLLASGSADVTIKLWDVESLACVKSYKHHTGKVCSIAWHPEMPAVLLSGSYDKSVVVADVRAPTGRMPRWHVESDVEIVKWNVHDPNYFFITSEKGFVHYIDVRTVNDSSLAKPVWSLQAHDEAVSAFDVNACIPNLFVTGSPDKHVKLWTISSNKSNQDTTRNPGQANPSSGPELLVSRDLGLGRIFTTSFALNRDSCSCVAVAGSKGQIKIWDTATNSSVRSSSSLPSHATERH